MITEIKNDVESLLKDFVFDDYKPKLGQVEDRLAEILDKFLNETDLVDYWVIVNFTGENSFDVRIGLQEGDFENTKINYIDCIVKK